MDRDREIQRQSNLKQNKDKSPEEIIQLVDKKIQEEELLTAFVGLKDDELEKALKLYNQYVTEHSFESLAEKSTLINVVRDEIIKERILKQMQEENENKSGANSLRLIEEIRELEDHILLQKEKLGMMKDKQNDSIYQLWKDLEEKCLKYYEEHAAEFQNKCPYCNKLFPSILPPEKLTPQVSSWFKGTDLYNEEVFNLYHNKIISEEQAAKILGVSKFYIPYIYQEIYLKEKNDK